MYGACRKIQHVDCPGIGWKPVLTVDLFSVGLKLGKEILIVLSPNVRDRLPKGFDNLKILIVYPDLAFEVPLVLFDLLRRDVEDETGNLVYLFLSAILQVVLTNVIGSQNERLDAF